MKTEAGRPGMRTALQRDDNQGQLYMAWYLLGVQHERERAEAADHHAALYWGRTAEQVERDRHAEMMQVYLECAESFHQRELGRPYREFKGVAA